MKALRSIAIGTLGVMMSSGLATASSDPAGRTIRATAGQEVRAAILGSARPDCSVGPRPEVRLIEPAKNGVVRIGPRTLRTTRVRNCPTLEVPVVAVFYRSNPGFVGTDTFRIEVKPYNGPAQIRTLAVEVQGKT